MNVSRKWFGFHQMGIAILMQILVMGWNIGGAEAQTRASYSSVAQALEECDFASAQEGIGRLGADPRRVSLEKRFQEKARYEGLTSALFHEANRMFLAGDNQKAVELLGRANDHTRCDRFSEKIQNALVQIKSPDEVPVVSPVPLSIGQQLANSENACAVAYPRSVPVWDEFEELVQCNCPQGTRWNRQRTACLTGVQEQLEAARDECADRYRGSVPTWNSEARDVYCQCPRGRVWNPDRTLCLLDEEEN